jgi:hypothetical protein
VPRAARAQNLARIGQALITLVNGLQPLLLSRARLRLQLLRAPLPTRASLVRAQSRQNPASRLAQSPANLQLTHQLCPAPHQLRLSPVPPLQLHLSHRLRLRRHVHYRSLESRVPRVARAQNLGVGGLVLKVETATIGLALVTLIICRYQCQWLRTKKEKASCTAVPHMWEQVCVYSSGLSEIC